MSRSAKYVIAAVGPILAFVEINEALFDVGAQKPDLQLISDVNALGAMNQSSFRRRIKDPDPCALRRSPCDNPFEPVSYLGRKQQSGS